jgi:hypothetical protein
LNRATTYVIAGAATGISTWKQGCACVAPNRIMEHHGGYFERGASNTTIETFQFMKIKYTEKWQASSRTSYGTQSKVSSKQAHEQRANMLETH